MIYRSVTCGNIKVTRGNKRIDVNRLCGQWLCFCKKIFCFNIFFLTAKSFDSDKSSAYNAGGDDYLVKPFSAPELLMKVDALTRRYNTYGAKESENTEAIRLAGGVVLFPEKREVMKNGEQIELRDKEYEVLVYLVKNRGRVVGADELYEAVWGEMSLPSSSNNITVHILNLRRKLEDNSSSPKVIRTVWGKGYQVD